MTQILQILTANGYSPSEVMDSTPLWLCRILIRGLVYRDMHLRSEQRLQRLLIAQPWSKEDLSPEDMGVFEWEDTPDNEIPPVNIEEMRAQDSAVIADIRNTLKDRDNGKR